MFRRILVALLALWTAAAGAAQAADRVEATYNFVWNGLVVFTADAVVDMTPSSYKIQMDIRTRGIMRLFSRGNGSLTSEGLRRADGSFMAQRFVSEGRWDGDNYRSLISFDNDGRVVKWERDWPDEWLEDIEREPVPEDMKKGPDALSLAMMLFADALPLNDPEAVVGADVFDGDEVTEIGLKCSESDEDIKKSRHSPFIGAARKCWFSAQTIAGKVIETEKLKAKRDKEQEKSRRRAEKYRSKPKADDDDGDEPGLPIWFMPISDVGHSLPVYAKIKSGWGTVRMYLKELKTSTDGVAAS